MDASMISDLFGEVTPIIPAVIMIVGALLTPALYYGLKRRDVVTAAAMVVIIASMVVNAILLSDDYAGTYSGIFEYNAFSGLMMLLFQIVASLTLFVSVSSTETTILHYGAFNSLMIISAVGMMFVAMSTDLVGIFVGVEAVSISSYALVTMKRADPRAAEAGVKYVIIGGMSTALTIYGISMIYGALGTLEISELAARLGSEGYTWTFVIGLITMVAGYGFKIAAVPFHMWAPDVYEGASTPVSILLAAGSKKMGLVVFFKVFMVMFVGAKVVSGLDIEAVQYIFAILAAFSMTVGNIVAIAQSNIKRMLAYSSIAQAGYILIAMAVMTDYALTGAMFHMFTHVFMKGGAFLIVGALVCVGIGEKITDYNGLAKRAPFLAFAMLVFLFSLAGIPPLAGFTSKFVLFSGAIFDEGPGGVMTQWIWLAFIAILNSAISLYYYVRVVKAMFIEKPAKGAPAGSIRIPRTFMAAIVVCLVMVVVLGIYPDPILGPCKDAADALIGAYL